MKKYGDLPVYFIIIGLILNIIMYFNNKVSFTNLMIRSIIVILLFGGAGYFLAYVLSDAHNALSKTPKKNDEIGNSADNQTSTIDIRLNSEDDDELFKILPQSENDEFVEINPQSFKEFMNQD